METQFTPVKRNPTTFVQSDLNGERASRRRYFALLSLSGILLLIPIWSAQYLPMNDYANHLSRCYILVHYHQIPIFNRNYHLVYEPIPNLACDLLIPFFMQFVDVQTAGKIFLTLTVVLYVSGLHLLGSSANGRGNWLAILAAYLIYCSQLYYGFLNFLFGLALFLVTFALWLKYRKAWTWQRMALIVLLTTLTYLSHLSSYAFLGAGTVVVLSIDSVVSRRVVRASVLSLVPLLPPLILFLLFMHGTGQTGNVKINWWPDSTKFISALSSFISYDYWLDGIGIGVMALAVFTLVLLWRRQRVVTSLFVLGILFAVLFVFCPTFLFTSFGADVRFVLPAWIFLVLSLRVNLPLRIGKVLFLAELLILITRLAFIEVRWIEFSKQISQDVDLVSMVPQQASLYPIYDPYVMGAFKRERFFKGITCYAVMNRNAYTAETFASPGQQPINMNLPERNDDNGIFYPSTELQWDTLFSENQYLWAYKPGQKVEEELRLHATLVGRAPGSELWRTKR